MKYLLSGSQKHFHLSLGTNITEIPDEMSLAALPGGTRKVAANGFDQARVVIRDDELNTG